MQRLAQLISIVLSPLTLLPLLLVVAIQQSKVDQNMYWSVLLIIFGVGVLIPIVSLLVLKAKGLVSDWGISVRSERHRMSIVAVLSLVMVWALLWLIGADELADFMAILLGGGIVFSLITLLWKISAHSSAVTLVGLYLMYWHGITWWLSVLLIVLVGWSRIVLKKHTLAQVVGGALLSVIIFLWSVLQGK